MKSPEPADGRMPLDRAAGIQDARSPATVGIYMGKVKTALGKGQDHYFRMAHHPDLVLLNFGPSYTTDLEKMLWRHTGPCFMMVPDGIRPSAWRLLADRFLALLAGFPPGSGDFQFARALWHRNASLAPA